jgi:hypothetical protein
MKYILLLLTACFSMLTTTVYSMEEKTSDDMNIVQKEKQSSPQLAKNFNFSTETEGSTKLSRNLIEPTGRKNRSNEDLLSLLMKKNTIEKSRSSSSIDLNARKYENLLERNDIADLSGLTEEEKLLLLNMAKKTKEERQEKIIETRRKSRSPSIFDSTQIDLGVKKTITKKD